MKKLLLQGIKFVGISGVGWILDFSIFNILNLFNKTIELNNIVSSLIAVCFVFSMSTKKAFRQKETGISIKIKFFVYVIYQIILIISISKLLALISTLILTYSPIFWVRNISAVVAKILVTPVTMLLNFVVMKVLIERM